MKQRFLDVTTDLDALKKDLEQVYNEFGDVCYHVIVTTTYTDKDYIDSVRTVVQTMIPRHTIICFSAAGNIANCDYVQGTHLTITIYDYESTKSFVQQYNLTEDCDDTDIAQKIVAFTESNDWVKVIALYHTKTTNDMTDSCAILDTIRPDVQIVGGILCNSDLHSYASFVYVDEYSTNGVIAIYLGGDDLTVTTKKVTGWTPIVLSLI